MTVVTNLLSTCILGPSGRLLAVLALSTALVSSAQQPALQVAKTNPMLPVAAAPDISYNVDVVLVPVSVIDSMNRPVLGLEKDDFTVYEDKQSRPIQYFFSEDAPVSVGLVLDFSSSMQNKAEMLREAIRRFFDNANPEDDYYVVTVSTHPRLIARATNSVHYIEQKLSEEKPEGWTALLDGVDLVLRAMQKSRYQRRVVVMITDGGDNDSHLSLRQVRSMVAEQNADVYGVGIFDDSFSFLRPLEERLGRHTLSRLTDATGGRTISVTNSAELPKAIADLSLEIRNQYVLGYRPQGLTKEGNWRKIRVAVKPRSNSDRLQATYKKKYFAAAR